MATPQLDEVLVAAGGLRDEVEALLAARDKGEKIGAGHILRAVFGLSGPLGVAVVGSELIKDEMLEMTEEDARRVGGHIGVFLLDIIPDEKLGTKPKR